MKWWGHWGDYQFSTKIQGKWILVLDELTNMTDNCLLLLFFQEVNAEHEVTEELASIKCLHSKNIFKIEKTSIQYNLKWNRLRCVTTDCDYVKNRKRLSWTDWQSLWKWRCLKLMVLHYIIHKQVFLLGKYFKLSCITKPVVSTSFTHRYDHRQFCTLW